MQAYWHGFPWIQVVELYGHNLEMKLIDL
jgi:hypothetical protein